MKENKKELLLTAAIYLQKLATAAADVLWLILLAEMIGEAISGNGITGIQFHGNTGKMAQYVLGLILLSAWKRMGYSLGRSLTKKLQNMVRFRLNSRMVEKTAKIPYRLLEDYAFCELSQALKEEIDGNFYGSFVWYTVQKSANFMMYCIRTLGLCLLLGRASLPLGGLFFLLQICHCLMTVLETQQNAALVESEQDSPEKRYMEELALGQRGAGERSLFAFAGYIGEKCDREARTARRAVFAHSLAIHRAELANRVLVTITYVLTELALSVLIVDGRISSGYFIALSIGACSLTQKNEEGDALFYLQREKLFLKQWNRFLNLPEMGESGEGEDGKECVIQEFETLEFRNVSFRYPRTGRYVLQDLNFKLTKGGYYAFVGVNGSGKTSIVKLLSGLYDNYEGEIRLNGIELREIPFSERRRIFAVLFQDAARYEDTIIQNIFPQEISAEKPERRNHSGESGGKPRDGKGETKGREESCEKGKTEGLSTRRLAEGLVREWEVNGSGRFPRGADTFLGSMEENGVILSAGEWQQLLIARELAQPSQILVLDEPMAGLDIFRQSKVCEQLTRDAGSRTTLLFSHHMAAVRKAKRIFVLKEGTIAEEGSHHELMSKKGLYARLYETQR